MRFFLERTLKRLEREGNDDLLQVHTLGPAYFTTPDLYDLLEKLERQKEIVAQQQTNLRRFGMMLPLFIIGAFLANYFAAHWLGLGLLAGVPFVLTFFTYHTVRIKRQFPTFPNSKYIERSIQMELKRRREESSIF